MRVYRQGTDTTFHYSLVSRRLTPEQYYFIFLPVLVLFFPLLFYSFSSFSCSSSVCLCIACVFVQVVNYIINILCCNFASFSLCFLIVFRAPCPVSRFCANKNQPTNQLQIVNKFFTLQSHCGSTNSSFNFFGPVLQYMCLIRGNAETWLHRYHIPCC